MKECWQYRYKKAVILAAALALAASLSACKNEEKTEPLTASDDPQKVLQAANEQYGKEKVRESRGTYVYTYMDGSTEEETVDAAFDAENGIQQLVYTSGGEESGRTFNVKDGGTFYTYALDMETNAWIRYEQEPDDNGETTYEVQERGADYLYDEESGCRDVTYSNEGEETLDGKRTVRIKVTGTMGETSGEEEEETDTVTRESILKDYEITEEAVGYIEGMSDALERYVDAMNASGKEEPTTFEANVWVETDTHRPLKNETVYDTGAERGTASQEDMSEFEDNLWKVYQLMDDMENGLSASEALENIKKQEPEMEKEIQAEKELLAEEGYEEGENDTMEEKSATLTEEKVYGGDCAKIGELPKHYTEITQEEYFNGEF